MGLVVGVCGGGVGLGAQCLQKGIQFLVAPVNYLLGTTRSLLPLCIYTVDKDRTNKDHKFGYTGTSGICIPGYTEGFVICSLGISKGSAFAGLDITKGSAFTR